MFCGDNNWSIVFPIAKAFMSGRLKVTGNIMAAQKLQQLWAENSDRELADYRKEPSKSEAKYDDDQDKALLEVSESN